MICSGVVLMGTYRKKHQKGGEAVPKQWRHERHGWRKKRHARARAWGVWLLTYAFPGSMAKSICLVAT